MILATSPDRCMATAAGYSSGAQTLAALSTAGAGGEG